MSHISFSIKRLAVVAAVLAAVASFAAAGEAKATLGSYYAASWTDGTCTQAGRIVGVKPISIRPTARAPETSEWVAWRTNLWRRASRTASWEYVTSSAWKVTSATGGTVYLPWDTLGGDSYDIYKPGQYAVVGQMHYYNLNDSAFTNIQLIFPANVFESYYTSFCGFGGA